MDAKDGAVVNGRKYRAAVRAPFRGGRIARVLLAAALGCDDGAGPGEPSNGLLAGAPAEWKAVGRTDVYEVGTDQGTRKGGATSAYVRARAVVADTTQFAALHQVISAIDYRGKRVRLSGWVRVDAVSGPGAGLWMRIDAATGTIVLDNMSGRSIRGTSDWAEHAVVLDVPSNAVGISFGMLLLGGGLARVDDMRLEVVDTSVPATAPPNFAPTAGDTVANALLYLRSPATPSNLDFEGVDASVSSASTWLGTAARPFNTDAPGTPLDDLAEVGRIVGDARIVAVGEATHGTREFFRMKHRVFEYLVERMGFTHFTIEATTPEARAVDRYVTTGVGDPSALLRGLLFWTWNTDEVLDLITWMRAYNVRAGAPKLRFFGSDMQSPAWALDSIPPMAGRAEPAFGVRAANAVSCLTRARRPGTDRYEASAYTTVDAPIRQACADSLRAMQVAAAEGRSGWSAMPAEDLDWLQHYIDLAVQWERMASQSSTGFYVRDSSMAANIGWISRTQPGAKLSAWAHNGHVNAVPRFMGGALRAAFGNSYRTFGFSFGRGSFNAVNMTSSGQFTGLQAHTVGAPIPRSLEALLEATRLPRAVVDMRPLPASGVRLLDRRPIASRSIGSVYGAFAPEQWYTYTIFPADYDAIIWFATTTASRLRSF